MTELSEDKWEISPPHLKKINKHSRIWEGSQGAYAPNSGRFFYFSCKIHQFLGKHSASFGQKIDFLS